MADRGVRKVDKRAAGEPPPTPATPPVATPAPPLALPPEMFSASGLLALADLVPVMTAYVDRDERYRFINKPYAEWLGRPRKEVLGLTMRELLGDSNYAD